MSIEKSIFRSLEIIEERINEKLTVENIAADVFISKYHYMRLFREIVGDSVMEYITKRKLTLAGEALLKTDASILDIALDYGYDSRDGFTRSFKAFAGLTPAQYRKHGQFRKENNKVEENQAIDSIVAELNEWIMNASDLAEQIRKAKCREPGAFWVCVAEQTEILTTNIRTLIRQIETVVNKPNEIMDSMEIVKTIDDTAFVMYIIAFQIEMTEAKIPVQSTDPVFTEKYRELAKFGVEKAESLSEFFRVLLLSVIDDMRETTKEKVLDAIEKGRTAAAAIPEKLNYIKDEIIQMTDLLSEAPIESMTMRMLEDSFFKIKLIKITTGLNIDESDPALFDKMQAFSDALNDASEFCKTIVTPDDEQAKDITIIKVMQDIVYMENVLFFHVISEIDSLCEELKESAYHKQTEDLTGIKVKINEFKKSTFYAERDENDLSVFHNIAGNVSEIVSDLNNSIKNPDIRGGAIKVITEELKRLVDKTIQCLKDIEVEQ